MDERRRVMLISEHPLFRAGLARVLEQTKAYQVVGQAASVEEALPVVQHRPVDVIIYEQVEQNQDDASLTALLQPPTNELITLSMVNPEMTIYSRRRIDRASLEQLLAVIREAGS